MRGTDRKKQYCLVLGVLLAASYRKRQKMIWRLIIVVSLLWSGLPLIAQSAPIQDERIARVTHAGYKSRQQCSGFLVAGGHLVTAAHCLPAIDSDVTHFALGFNRGTFLAHLAVRSDAFQIHETHDLAVACNVAPHLPSLIILDHFAVPQPYVTVRGYGSA